MSSGAGVLDTGHAQRVDLDAGESRLAALVTGDAGAPPILLVPGYTGSKEDFGPLLDPLAAAGYRAVAIDLPGQYESPGPDDPAGYTPDALARVVLAAIHSLGAPLRLLGHSYGGLVARAVALSEPTALHSLVLLSSGPAQIGGERRTRVELLAPLLAAGGVPAVHEAMRQQGAEAPPGASDELVAFLTRRFLAGHPAMLAGMGNAIRVEPDRVAELAATGVRTLVVHGVDDDAWPPAAQADMARRLGARYEVVADAAHSAAVENPAALLPVLLDFWRS